MKRERTILIQKVKEMIEDIVQQKYMKEVNNTERRLKRRIKN